MTTDYRGSEGSGRPENRTPPAGQAEGAGQDGIGREHTNTGAAPARADLSHLAGEIQAEHDRAFGKAREALAHARRAGELLIQAKAACGHGAWLPWLQANVAFSPRQAQRYIRLAENWQSIETKCDTVSHLTQREALACLASPDDEDLVDLPGRIQLLTLRVKRLAEEARAVLTPIPGEYEALHADLHRLYDDALGFLGGTSDIGACAAIADTALSLEMALTELRVRCERAVGMLLAELGVAP